MRVIFSLALIAATTSIAEAEATKCADFKNTLAAETINAGRAVAIPRLDKIAYERDDKTMVRYELEGIVGLSGSLICEPVDQLQSLFVSTDVVPGNEGVFRLARLEALAAAAICSTQKKINRRDCKAIVKEASGKAINDLSRQKARGEPSLGGTSDDVDLGGGYTIEFTTVPGSLSFSFFGPR